MKRREFIAGTLAAAAVGGSGRADAGRFACAADRVFDGERALTGHAVVVEGERVAEVLPASSLPPDLPRLSHPGCTILPGLMDVHAHFLTWEGPLFLAWGVTTIRDTGNALDWILARRAEWQRHPWPRILCAVPLLDGPSPFHPLMGRACRDSADAVAAVRETAAAGVDAIKLYVGLSPEWIPEMARASHEAGLKVSMHCAGAGVTVAARAGVDEFHHLDGVGGAIWPDHPPGWLDVWGDPGFASTWNAQQRLADLIRESGMAATPTFAYWDSQRRVRSPSFARSGERHLVPPEMVTLQSPAKPNVAGADRWRRALGAAQGFVRLLLERGVRVLPGSDTPCGALVPGRSLWRELSLLTGAGMTPEQALRAATSDAADFLGKADLGRLRPGAVADMVFVRGNPTERIPRRPEIIATVHGGVPHAHADLLAAADAAISQPCDDPWMLQFRAHGRPSS